MSLFGTISPSALPETSTPIMGESLHCAQIACDPTGIPLIPTSGQRECTNCTIANNTMHEDSNFILSDLGCRSLRA